MECQKNRSETSEQAFVKEKIGEAGIEIPDVANDRARTIGSPRMNHDKRINVNAVIVRFTTFRHRTMLAV